MEVSESLSLNNKLETLKKVREFYSDPLYIEYCPYFLGLAIGLITAHNIMYPCDPIDWVYPPPKGYTEGFSRPAQEMRKMNLKRIPTISMFTECRRI